MSANATQATTTSWNIDPAHTTAEFKVKHMMITNVKGQLYTQFQLAFMTVFAGFSKGQC